MNLCKKIKKLFFSYPFLLGLLTSVLINFGGHWIVKVKEFTNSEVSYTIIAGNDDLPNSNDNNINKNNNQENRDIIVSENEVPVLDYDPDDYEPERIDIGGEQGGHHRVAKITPGEDGILRLKLSNVDTFDNRFLRPRFLADEITTKKKSCVAILASSVESLETRSVFLNNLLKNYLDKVIVFVSTSSDKYVKSSNISNLVAFQPSKHSGTMTLKVLNFLVTKMVSNFETFFIIPDSVYVNPHRLTDFEDQLSVDDDLYIGLPVRDPSNSNRLDFCDIKSGFLLSQSLLKSFKSNLDWCSEHCTSDDVIESFNVGKCIQKGFPISCQPSMRDAKFKVSELNSRNPDIAENSVVAFPIQDVDQMKRIHKTALRLELELKQKLVSEMEKEIMSISKTANFALSSGGKIFSSTSWPPGSNPMTRSKDRHDNDVWIRFNSSHFHRIVSEQRSTPLSNVLKMDISDVIKEAVAQAEKSLHGRGLIFNKLQTGWFRFDANRGTDYLLLLTFKNADIQVDKFLHVFRELSHPKTLQDSHAATMPFITEAIRMTVLVPIGKGEVESGRRLLARFLKNCITESSDRGVHLVLVLLPDTENVALTVDQLKEDVLQAQLRKSEQVLRKDKTNWNVTLTSMTSLSTLSNDVTHHSLLNHVFTENLVDGSSLIFLGSTDMELKLEFVNRIRMNTLAGRQIFIPVPFASFHPKVVQWLSRGLHKPAGGNGHFDLENHNFISFYMSDYLRAKDKIQAADPQETMGQFFRSRLPEILILEAPDPNLSIFYRDQDCQNSGNFEKLGNSFTGNRSSTQEQCDNRMAASLGLRGHLGKIIIDWEEKQQQHQQQQKQLHEEEQQ